MFHHTLGKVARPKIKLHVEKIFLGVGQTQGRYAESNVPSEDSL